MNERIKAKIFGKSSEICDKIEETYRMSMGGKKVLE